MFIWIIDNQFGRRNLSIFARAELALKLKAVVAEKAKENLKTHTEQGYQNSDKAVHTLPEIAKKAQTSHDTICKYLFKPFYMFCTDYADYSEYLKLLELTIFVAMVRDLTISGYLRIFNTCEF